MSLMADRILILLQSREIKQQASSFHLSRLSIIDGSSSRLFELKKKNKFENKVGALCFMRSFSVFNCQSSLLCICLSTSFFSSSLVWKSDEFIGCGGLPVEVKRESGSASDSPIILYGSSCGRAFITLNYMPRLLPPTPQPVQDGPGLIVLSSYPGGT